MGAGRPRPHPAIDAEDRAVQGLREFLLHRCFRRTNECDLFIAVPGGLYLLELKGHPGRVVNHGDTWQFHDDRIRTLKNPLRLTDLKCKELKDQLQRAARDMGEDPRRVPFIRPAVFLHAPGLVSGLDEFQRINVFGRNLKSHTA
ncbi:nuclease-related domain-containing protein [Streptomyces sp. WMMB 322]|uniref:nuclease-related domain-containing protein n=1 Tax=Streptomyces sp. WMMB 322 TaxID=1286821 RepID=UPI0006E46481|nr:nuclease-related domain-containing protein [Streptomyces sp. WMMB 322]SCK23114.1 Nuclease-related domain-containing protein [Streptomyces sp. WMMB 322]